MNWQSTLNTLMAGVGAVTGFLFGNSTFLLKMLFILVILDYLSGIISSAINGTLSSHTGSKGIFRKVLIFIVVAVAHQADLMIGESSMFRNAAIAFYIWNEMLSIIENAAEAKVPIPRFLRNMILVLRDKENKNEPKP